MQLEQSVTAMRELSYFTAISEHRAPESRGGLIVKRRGSTQRISFKNPSHHSATKKENKQKTHSIS